MKHIATILSLFLLLFATSCENANVKKLKKEVAKTNAQCPVNYGIGGDLLSVKYDEQENSIMMYVSINNEIGGAFFLKNNREAMQKQLKLVLQNAPDRTFIKDLVNAGASLNCIYKNSSTGKTLRIKIDADELKEIYDNPMSITEARRTIVENKVELENAGCPTETEDGITMAKVAIVDDNVVYYYQMDESIYDFSSMDSELMKQNIIDSWREMRNDPTVLKEMQLMTEAGMGYQFRYFGNNSKKYVDIILRRMNYINYSIDL